MSPTSSAVDVMAALRTVAVLNLDAEIKFNRELYDAGKAELLFDFSKPLKGVKGKTEGEVELWIFLTKSGFSEKQADRVVATRKKRWAKRN